MFCDSFAIQPPSVTMRRGRKMGLSLWPVTQAPLHSSMRSLSVERLNHLEDLKSISVLAVFSYLPEGQDNEVKENFEFPVEKFRSMFHPESFNQPINLANDSGFCFVLTGKESNSLCRSRCISLVRIVGLRALLGEKVMRSQPLFELFPCLSKFSLRFPLNPPPLSETSFIPLKTNFPKFPVKENNPCLLWEKADKIERWRRHVTSVTDSIFIGSEWVAKNEALLKKHGITHILNAAAQVVTSAPGFVTLNLRMVDGGGESLLSHVFAATIFIDEAVRKKGKVLVHCVEGVSRSVALVIAYFILKEKIDYQTMYKRIRAKRRVAGPNPKFIAQLIQLAEIVGGCGSETCCWSMEKTISFEIREKNDAIKAMPLYEDEHIPAENPDRCFITIDYSQVGAISKRDNAPPGILKWNIGQSCRKDLVDYGLQFAGQLCKCLRIKDESGRVKSEVHVYSSPDWKEVPLEAIDIPNSETVYVVVDGIAYRMIVGADVPEDVDLDEEMQNCCDAIGDACPSVYDLIDLADDE